MIHPQEVPLIFRVPSTGMLLPTSEQRQVRIWLDLGRDLGEDMAAHEEAYRAQLSRQMEALSV